MIDQDINTIAVEETNSTNELAKSILREKKESLPFLVKANFQTSGKGQYTKSWESNPGENLLFSIAFRPEKVSIEDQFIISKVIAVSLLEVLQDLTHKVSIKWPNDIYIDNKKIAGILIENAIIGQNIDSCVIGIGFNVNQTQFSELLPNPTSLKLLNSKLLDIDLLKDKIVNQFFLNMEAFKKVEELYDKHLYRKGELGLFRDDLGNDFLGVILGINAIGQLLLRVENSIVRSFSNNEIQYLKP